MLPPSSPLSPLPPPPPPPFFSSYVKLKLVQMKLAPGQMAFFPTACIFSSFFNKAPSFPFLARCLWPFRSFKRPRRKTPREDGSYFPWFYTTRPALLFLPHLFFFYLPVEEARKAFRPGPRLFRNPARVISPLLGHVAFLAHTFGRRATANPL